MQKLKQQMVKRYKHVAKKLAIAIRKLWAIKKVRIICAILAGIIIFAEAGPLVMRALEAGNYDLTAAKNLVDPTSTDLRDKFSFDDKSQTWNFNTNAEAQLPGQTGNDIKVGGLTYSAELPVEMSAENGLKLTDEASKLDMKMSPQFGLGKAKVKEGYAVYPIRGSNAQLIYTFHQGGVKEDIVLHKAPRGDKVEYSYTLDLPESLEARMQQDGSVGIFGGDRSLFGNISYGSDKDKELVEKARKNSEKDTLYYAIPAPTIAGEDTGGVKAKFILEGDTVTVSTTGLKKANYPLSIDPSFVMNTTNCSWEKTGVSEGNMSYTGCQLKRSGLTGGKLGTWGTTSPMVTDYYGTETVAANGFLYVLGGRIDSTGGGHQGVQYAAINPTNGTVGAFHYTHDSIDDNTTYVSGYNSAHVNDFRAFAYNGYLYVVGGSSNSAVTSTIDRAPLNANGTVGTWSVLANQMNTGRVDFGLEVYNGYMYAFSGCTSINITLACTGYSNTLEYAKINGDGTVGTWTLSGNNLTTTRIDMTSAVYNGYLYAFGGCVSNSAGLDNCAGGLLSSVEYAAIDSATGAVGTWSVANSFTTARRSMNVASYNGYMYMFGGAIAGGTIQSDVQMAKIYANGKLGPWQTTTALAGVRKDMGVTTYNGYIYTAGGCSANGSNCGGSGGIAEVRYSQVSTALGDVSPFTTETDTIPTTNGTVQSGATVMYGGYMYIVGGQDKDGTNSTNIVRYAQLNTDGSTGAWGTTSAFTDARTSLAATAYNGYMYIAGGHRHSGTTNCPDLGLGVDYCTDIQYAQINSNGTLGAWASAGGPYAGVGNTGRSGLGMVAYNGYVYVMGGNYNNNSNVSTEVDIAPINTNGTVGTWTQNASGLGTTARALFGLAQTGPYVYILGGRAAPGGYDNADVIYATLSSNGGMSAWASAGPNFSNGRTPVFAGAANGYLYIAGGASNGAIKDVQYIKINTATGALSGSWTTSAIQFNTRRINHQGGIYNGYLYLAGGCQSMTLEICNNPINQIEYAQIYNGGGGVIDTLTTQGATGAGRIQLGAASHNNYVYIAGGCTGNLGAGPMNCTNLGRQSDVRYAPMGGSGTIGSWAGAGSDFTTARNGLSTVAYNGYLYVMGGCSSGSSGNCDTFENDVQYALICTGSNNGVGGCGATAGAVGTWSSTNGFTTGRYGLTGLASNGYLYVLGGCSATSGGACTTYQSDVQKALICTGSNNGVGGCGATAGAVGTWSSAGSNFATGRVYQAAAINGNYVYVMGGCSAMTGVACTTYLSDTQYRQLDIATGNLTGSWNVGTSSGVGAFGSVATAYNGYLYLTGGCTGMSGGNCETTLDTVSYAPLFSNGSVGNWTIPASRLASPRALHGLAVSRGHLTILNGVTQTNSFITTASTAPLLSTPQIARHSMLLTTDARTQPASFFGNVSGQTGSSSANVSVSTANDPGIALTSLGTNYGIGSTSKYSLVSGNDGTKYYWLSIELDDSQSMTFDEASGSSMSYLQLNYHPNPGMRLRGGKTFNQGTQQSLDAR